MSMNRQVFLVAQPDGIPQASHFALREAPVPEAAEATVAEAFVDEGIVVVHKAPTKKKDPSHTDEMRTLSKAILDAGRETRRLPLTLAVIILVIVATLTID